MACQLFGMRRKGQRCSRRNKTHVTKRVTIRWCLMRRKRTRTRPDDSTLPDDIVEQILLKIRCIKSIVTCTIVCKSWYVLIKSPWFITMQLSRPNNNTEYFICSYPKRPFYSIRCYDGQRLQNYYDLEFSGKKRFNVHGSCNGLICYTKFDNVSTDIYLWNPTIQKLKTLPKSMYYAEWTAYGFWFDTNSEDYKVAKISCIDIFKVEVYSLSSNSWDIITTTGPGTYYNLTCFINAVHVNGTLYWLICASGDWKIVSVNTKNGVFQDTLICPAEEEVSKFVLYTSGAHSCPLFVLRKNSDSTGIQVYDENLKELYRNEVEIGGKEILCHPLGIRNNSGEVLFQKHGTYRPILVFNIRELKFKSFCSSTRPMLKVIPFVETLVLLDDGGSSSTFTSK